MNDEEILEAKNVLEIYDRIERKYASEPAFSFGKKIYSLTKLREIVRKEEERILHEHRMETCASYRALKTPWNVNHTETETTGDAECLDAQKKALDRDSVVLHDDKSSLSPTEPTPD